MRRGELGPDTGDWPEVELGNLRTKLATAEQRIDCVSLSLKQIISSVEKPRLLHA